MKKWCIGLLCMMICFSSFYVWAQSDNDSPARYPNLRRHVRKERRIIQNEKRRIKRHIRKRKHQVRRRIRRHNEADNQ